MPDKFIVPQFIDKEDQILGPITVRQFLIMLVGTFAIFICYKILQFLYFIFATVLIAGVGGTFAFVKVNGQAFHIFFINMLQTVTRPALRVWDKRPTDLELREYIKPQAAPLVAVSTRKEAPPSSRLRDLTLVVNTGGVYKPEDDL
jgi:hypothetical protein